MQSALALINPESSAHHRFAIDLHSPSVSDAAMLANNREFLLRAADHRANRFFFPTGEKGWMAGCRKSNVAGLNARLLEKLVSGGTKLPRKMRVPAGKYQVKKRRAYFNAATLIPGMHPSNATSRCYVTCRGSSGEGNGGGCALLSATAPGVARGQRTHRLRAPG